ncbi:MAG: hypothetical protein COU46_01695 [Candidatus Niyogibacteria bacterium CG10_big_fil_rev_8_21_14_0_10_42_19]|uniref:Amidinotransferase n=1 Tax=Candidatus Niyogibacteria bacterium CG10_big_fil_rev_8_21_14_0_10_42_19 TaxID=1974725 RepID=A0A2H0TFR6_9BACT|nr:MAG: hypothetical protein COU46_01695 [Candidatus Niyogibacteria bacterium CG10_big_fil_rev_8_21_14_0_10_42_19]
MYETRGIICPPDGFRIDHDKVINAWMNPSVQPDPDLAMSQWRNIFCKFVQCGMKVYVMGGDTGFQDQCFTANIAHFRNGKIVLANFVGKIGRVRAREVPLFQKWIEARKQKFNIDVVPWPEPDVAFEGQGDVVSVGHGKNSILLVGYGQGRSDREAADVLSEIHVISGKRVIPMKLICDKFYHLDTACMYIPSGSYFITDGAGFMLKRKLRHYGIEVVTVNTDEFRKSGGSTRCLTFLFPKERSDNPDSGVFIYYPKAFDSVGRDVIKYKIAENFPVKLIEVNEQEAKRFVCNGVFIRK